MNEAWREWEGHVVDGKFVLRQLLGGNQSSAVFRTEYGGPEPRKAAIKLVVTGNREADLILSRWEQAAELSHPNLMKLFDAGRWQVSDLVILYLVMEFADEDLSQILPTRALTPAEVRDMLEPALDVLAYLHTKGFVHRRLKPSNMMAVEDQLKFSSDGLRKAGESEGRSSRADIYDAPEIAGGVISPAADLWSLGATLVEALTQRPPVPHEVASVAQKLPSPFDDIVRNCLLPNPDERWTVADVAARLQEKTSASRPLSASVIRNPRRYRIPAAAAGLGLLVTAAVVAIVPGLRDRHSELPAPPPVAETPAPAPKPHSTDPKGQTPKAQTKSRRKEPSRITTERSSPPPAPRSQLKATTLAAAPAGPADILHRAMPSVPPDIRSKINGTVRVSVKAFVDPAGNVAYANLESGGPSRYFAERALEAARLWKFAPPNVEGRKASSIWILRFSFTTTNTQITPNRMVP